MSAIRTNRPKAVRPASLANLKRGGSTGRKPGQLNKATVEVKESARGLVEDPEYRKRLGLRLISGNLAPAMETTLWAYAYGKPKETLALEGSVTVSASLTPTPELRAKIAALLEKFPTV